MLVIVAPKFMSNFSPLSSCIYRQVWERFKWTIPFKTSFLLGQNTFSLYDHLSPRNTEKKENHQLLNGVQLRYCMKCKKSVGRVRSFFKTNFRSSCVNFERELYFFQKLQINLTQGVAGFRLLRKAVIGN